MTSDAIAYYERALPVATRAGAGELRAVLGAVLFNIRSGLGRAELTRGDAPRAVPR